MESKYKTEECGTLSEKWDTEGTLFTEYSIDERPIKGLGFNAAFIYNAAESKKNLKLGAKYRNENLNVGCTLANAFDSNVNVVGAAVAGYKEFLIGYQAGYNTSTSKVTKNDIALAYNFEDVGIHLRCTSIPYEYGLSVFHRVNSEWDTAINGVFAKNGNNQRWTVGAGARYQIDDKSMLRFKFNKDLQLGTSLQQKVRDGVTITLSFNLDCTNVAKGGHKVGLALDLEA